MVWGSRFAPALARLFFELQKESGGELSDTPEEEDEDERVERLANRITRKDHFDRVEEAYNLGREASNLETSYRHLGDDGTRAFVALFVFAVLLPISALFGLLPGAEEQDAKWVAAVTLWAVVVMLGFGVAAFFAGRFWRRKALLNNMLDEYET